MRSEYREKGGEFKKKCHAQGGHKGFGGRRDLMDRLVSDPKGVGGLRSAFLELHYMNFKKKSTHFLFLLYSILIFSFCIEYHFRYTMPMARKKTQHQNFMTVELQNILA